MATNRSELQALVGIMDGLYQQIREIESVWSIMGAEGDFRPRIEYYHDAIRTLMSGDDNPSSKFDRLAPERLAYDVAMLRQIIAKPASAGRGNQHFSAGDALVPYDGVSHSIDDGPDRKKRQELAGFYKDYTVLFVALLAQKVDDNTQIRNEENTSILHDCASLKQALEQLAQGSAMTQDVLQVIAELDHDALRSEMKKMVSSGKLSKEDIAHIISKLTQMRDKVLQERQVLEKASFNYSAGQLAVFEDAKDTVKRYAANGLNIVGKFVESAMQRSQGSGYGRNY